MSMSKPSKKYLVIISDFFIDVGGYIPRQSNHHLSSGIVCASRGSLSNAPGISFSDNFTSMRSGDGEREREGEGEA